MSGTAGHARKSWECVSAFLDAARCPTSERTRTLLDVQDSRAKCKSEKKSMGREAGGQGLHFSEAPTTATFHQKTHKRPTNTSLSSSSPCQYLCQQIQGFPRCAIPWVPVDMCVCPSPRVGQRHGRPSGTPRPLSASPASHSTPLFTRHTAWKKTAPPPACRSPPMLPGHGQSEGFWVGMGGVQGHRKGGSARGLEAEREGETHVGMIL